jgi:hypothetical protein
MFSLCFHFLSLCFPFFTSFNFLAYSVFLLRFIFPSYRFSFQFFCHSLPCMSSPSLSLYSSLLFHFSFLHFPLSSLSSFPSVAYTYFGTVTYIWERWWSLVLRSQSPANAQTCSFTLVRIREIRFGLLKKKQLDRPACSCFLVMNLECSGQPWPQ